MFVSSVTSHVHDVFPLIKRRNNPSVRERGELSRAAHIRRRVCARRRVTVSGGRSDQGLRRQAGRVRRGVGGPLPRHHGGALPRAGPYVRQSWEYKRVQRRMV